MTLVLFKMYAIVMCLGASVALVFTMGVVPPILKSIWGKGQGISPNELTLVAIHGISILILCTHLILLKTIGRGARTPQLRIRLHAMTKVYAIIALLAWWIRGMPLVLTSHLIGWKADQISIFATLMDPGLSPQERAIAGLLLCAMMAIWGLWLWAHMALLTSPLPGADADAMRTLPDLSHGHRIQGETPPRARRVSLDIIKGYAALSCLVYGLAILVWLQIETSSHFDRMFQVLLTSFRMKKILGAHTLCIVLVPFAVFALHGWLLMRPVGLSLTDTPRGLPKPLAPQTCSTARARTGRIVFPKAIQGYGILMCTGAALVAILFAFFAQESGVRYFFRPFQMDSAAPTHPESTLPSAFFNFRQLDLILFFKYCARCVLATLMLWGHLFWLKKHVVKGGRLLTDRRLRKVTFWGEIFFLCMAVVFFSDAWSGWSEYKLSARIGHSRADLELRAAIVYGVWGVVMLVASAWQAILHARAKQRLTAHPDQPS